MNIVIDLILIAIVAVSAFLAAKKGFIGTVFSLISVILAVILSIALCNHVSGFINDNFVKPSVKSYIIGVVDSSSIGKSYDDALNSIDVASTVKSMPDGLKKVLQLADIDTDEIVEKAQKTVSDSKEAKDKLIDSIANPISSAISRVIALLVLFVVLSIALWFVCKVITAITKAIPFGKSLNTFGGLALGAVKGLIIVFVISIFFTAVSKGVDPKSNNIFSQKTIDSTVVLKTVSDLNPIGMILNIK